MTLLAGAAVRDISPLSPLFLFGYPHVPRTSTGIHDPLLASVLYLEDGPVGVVLGALDLCLLAPANARRLRRRVAERLGLPEANVLYNCSHTHSGPVPALYPGMTDDSVVPLPDAGCLQRVEDQAVAAAVAAQAARRPALAAWTTAAIDGVGCNRLSPDGPRDGESGVLLVRTAAGAPLALVMTYAMHPTVLHEDSTLVSSDFPHYARQQLQETIGTEMVVVYHTAPCGNQSPRHHVRGQTFAEAERLGRRLGTQVATAAQAVAPSAFRSTLRLAGALAQTDLPRRRLAGVAEAEENLRQARATWERLQRENAGHGPVRTAECAVFGAEEAVTLARCQATGGLERVFAEYLPADVQVLRIGDCCLAGLPGELFVEYALALKARAPCRTFPVELANGDLQGYIVTPAAEAAGTYEARNSIFASAAGDVLVEAALALVAKLA